MKNFSKERISSLLFFSVWGFTTCFSFFDRYFMTILIWLAMLVFTIRVHIRVQGYSDYSLLHERLDIWPDRALNPKTAGPFLFFTNIDLVVQAVVNWLFCLGHVMKPVREIGRILQSAFGFWGGIACTIEFWGLFLISPGLVQDQDPQSWSRSCPRSYSVIRSWSWNPCEECEIHGASG